MRKGQKSDKSRVVKIICESFNTNPHINHIIRNDKTRPQRLAKLAEYAFYYGHRRNGVHLTDDGYGVAIIFEYDKIPMNWYEYYFQLILAIKSFSLPRSFMVSKLESLIKQNRASDVNFLYLWFFGVADEALGTSDGRDLMKFIFNMSHRLELPIYLETSIKRNMIIYKRFGFKEYNIFKTGHDDLTVWYMQRPYTHKL